MECKSFITLNELNNFLKPYNDPFNEVREWILEMRKQ